VNRASVRVLEKLGMRIVDEMKGGQNGVILVFERRVVE
jgi:RimJ/RimL family protein N-acetyltransferase